MATSTPERFGAAYYDRFYRNTTSRVSSQQAINRRANFVCGYVNYLQQPVRRMLDVGCGFGHWQAPIAKHYPRAKYVGMELSAYLCERHGWLHASITERVPRGAFDLVICQDVLQYIADRDLATALDNLTTACRGVLYLEALTQEDWRSNVDQKRTDRAVHLRPVTRYRKALRQRGFTSAGGGVFVAASSPAVLFELEKG
jgi:SAM-dependent methyltransferase